MSHDALIEATQVIAVPQLDLLVRWRAARHIDEAWIQEQLEESVAFDGFVVFVAFEAPVLQDLVVCAIGDGCVDFVARFVRRFAGPVHDGFWVGPFWRC